MTDADHVFILTLSDSEIDIVRRAAIMLGKTVTNIVHDFVMEEAERTIEDGEMCSRMARQDMSRARAYDSDDRSEKDAMWEGCQNRTYFM
jgi:uncharacterized protein (DUF1778 family)